MLLDTDNAVTRSYGTFKFPETYILDKNGIVRYKIIGPKDWADPAVLKVLRDMASEK